MPRSRPILVIQAILAAAIVFFGAAGLSDRIDPDVVYFANLAIGAITAALGVYLSGTNVSSPQVVATQTEPGAPVMAGAATIDSIAAGEELPSTAAVGAITS